MCKIDILYHFNEKYAPFAGISMTSLFENNRQIKRMRVFVMGEGLTEESLEKFSQLSAKYQREMIFLDIDNLIKMMQNINMPNYRGSYAANMRLFVSDIIPDDVERLVYFDSDTIIAGSLDEIIGMDLQDYPIAMVIDSLGFEHKRELKIKGNYYNSGTIVYQMDIWRREMYSYKIIEHIKKVRSHYPMPDQDLLNIVCENRIMTLNPKYNLQPVHVVFPWNLYYWFYGKKGYYSREEVEEALRDPVVYHFFRFCGEFPWNRNSAHPDEAIFDKYMRMSLWKDYVKVNADLSLPFRIEKIMYKFLPKPVFMFAFEQAHKRMVHRANLLSLKNEVYSEF